MAQELHELEIFVIVNSDGEFVVSHDEEEAGNLWSDPKTGYGVHLPTRHLSLTVKVPTPKALAVAVTVPDEPTEAVGVVAN